MLQWDAFQIGETGIADVVVDQSDDLMQFELENVDTETSPQRNKVHVGSKEFEHLRDLDMNKLCARVEAIVSKMRTGAPLLDATIDCGAITMGSRQVRVTRAPQSESSPHGLSGAV